ncbi:hypothetical protein [Vibrio ezurae]|uniref:Uncharacterized protein n=1 Tax=Vibrio ezurae NBRC 102218 TaxID=1219080 RepID=U3B5N5_9VIBR|nr:hypothetical protein [Vibrio ezurae]GAD81240.1 hypothetical protein VEZ01S_53_00400 [Vibrio ezurae NBRC 102218]
MDILGGMGRYLKSQGPGGWLFIGFGLFLAYTYYQGENEKKDHQEYVARFDSSMPSLLHKKEIGTVHLSNSSKVLPVNLNDKAIDWVLFRLNERNKPADPSQVTRVIGYKNCKDNLFGEYTDNTKAYQESCQIFIIDTKHHRWQYIGRLKGGEPPNSKKGSGSRTGQSVIRTYLIKHGYLK